MGEFKLNYDCYYYIPGGFKVWECTIDIIKYLIDMDINFKGAKVLDLGCGVGILGIYALQNDSIVTFQDYVSR